MQYLTPKQFNYSTRYQSAGLGKDDVSALQCVVRRLQEGECKESGKVGDLTYTVWLNPTTKPGVVLRTCFMSLLAEKAEKLVVGDVISIHGNIINSFKGPWLKATNFEMIHEAQVRPEPREESTL